jgi:N-methylhydantoinase B
VAEDVLEGTVSLENARKEYGVALDPDTFDIDQQETNKVRSKV